eukprot:145207-Amorphochlora_amoeboformis.AAC.1
MNVHILSAGCGRRLAFRTSCRTAPMDLATATATTCAVGTTAPAETKTLRQHSAPLVGPIIIQVTIYHIILHV